MLALIRLPRNDDALDLKENRRGDDAEKQEERADGDDAIYKAAPNSDSGRISGVSGRFGIALEAATKRSTARALALTVYRAV